MWPATCHSEFSSTLESGFLWWHRQTERHPNGSTLRIEDRICLEVKIKYQMDAVVLKHINEDASNNSIKGCHTILQVRMVRQVFASNQLERKKIMKKSFIWETCSSKIVAIFSLTLLFSFQRFLGLFAPFCTFCTCFSLPTTNPTETLILTGVSSSEAPPYLLLWHFIKHNN